MTRLTDVLQFVKPTKKFENYRFVPLYKQVLPPKLRDFVRAKGEKNKERPCLGMMSDMLICFSNNDYNEAMCSKEIQRFKDCLQKFEERKNQMLEDDVFGLKKGRRLSKERANELLRRYPQR